MSSEFQIEFDWLDRASGDGVDRACFASIGLRVGDEYLTRLDDKFARTTRDRLRADAHRLALWFASNWWRLHWEYADGDQTPDPGWRMAHSLAGAGGGFVWPDAVFTRIGEFIEISASPSRHQVSHEPIRYLARVVERVPITSFERAVDDFIESVVARLGEYGIAESDLLDLWQELRSEREGDASARDYRRIEALAGFDPDEAPPELIQAILDDQSNLGRRALEEVAAGTRHRAFDAVQSIRKLAHRLEGTAGARFRIAVPDLQLSEPDPALQKMPWELGAEAARVARRTWSLGDGPLPSRALARLLDTQEHLISDPSLDESPPLPVALRVEGNGHLDVFLNRPNPTTRRFALARLIGDHLQSRNGERLLPSTSAKTSRQQFQRAFAQEFLCPLVSLKQALPPGQPDEDDIAEAAATFDVSPLMVRTTLVNNGLLDRDSLTQGA